jgi:NADH dehydrogenase
MSKHIVILGGGFGGLLSALTVRKYLSASQADVTLVNRWPTHQIITELHRLAAGNIKEEAVSLPLAKLLKGKSVNLKIATVEAVNPDARQVRLNDGSVLAYDTLVLALGSETAFFGIPGLAENSFVLKSVNDAHRIRNHILSKLDAFAQHGNEADGTIVVGGGGLTGVEVVGELADQMPEWCRSRGIDPADIRLYCVEAAPSILPGFPQELIDRAYSSLESRGVRFVTGQPITEVKGTEICLKDGSTIQAGTLIWSGGVQGHPIVASCGIEVNRGRAVVNEYLQSVSHPDIFVAGDSAVVMAEDGRPYPPTAQIAWQMGETIGYNIFAGWENAKMKPFKPVISGTLASLGRKDGIAAIGARRTQLKGIAATAMKEASHIRYLAHIKGLFALAH